MKTITLKISLFLLLSGFQYDVFAQPANDDACNAITIVVDDPPLAIDDSGATVQTNEVVPVAAAIGNACVNSWCEDDPNVQNSVWFNFVAPENGAVIINTCVDTTNFDTQIALWAVSDCSSFESYVFVRSNDDAQGGCDSGNNYSSTITIDGLTPGNIYYIQVDGYEAAEGSLGIEVTSSIPLSKFNFIHNSADASINLIDIRVNGILYADNLPFQECTGFIDLPADVESYITLNDSESEDDSAPLAFINTTPNSSFDYIATISGINSSSGYSPSPPLQLSIFENALIWSDVPGTVPILFFHGATDVPTVDLINAETTNVFNNDIAYGTYSNEGYVINNDGTFSLMITDEDGNDLGFNYCLPLAQAIEFSAAITLVISGFATPTNNSDGLPLHVFVVNHFDGTFIPLDAGLCQFPSNDNICEALNLVVNDPPTTVNNALASVEEGESSPTNLPGSDPESDCLTAWCDGEMDHTLWFTFTAPPSGNVQVSTCFEISMDTQIAVCAVGDCNDFESVSYLAANDDMDGGCAAGDEYASMLVVEGLTPGALYYIQTDGWENETAEFDIQVTEIEVHVSENNSSKILIYPNPANDFISIQGAGNFARIEIRDMNGRIIVDQPKTPSTIDLSQVSAGMYTVLLHLQDEVIVKKIIIE